jgi:hypothetical protein
MPDVEFAIGGKNETAKAINSTVAGLSRLEMSFGSIIKTAAGFTLVSGTINTALRGIERLGSLISAGVSDYDKATEANRALRQAMELNGGATDEAVQKNIELADSLERRTNIEAEAIAEMMKSAAMLGVENEQLDDVAQAAIGLSEAMGIGLDDALKKARLATEGNFDSFNRLIPSLKDMATNEEKLAAVMQLANNGMAQKEARADSAADAYQRMQNKVGNMMEALGEALSPFRKLALDGIGFAAEKITEVMLPALESMKAVFLESGNIAELFQRSIAESINKAVQAFTLAEVVIENLDTAFGFLLDSGSLQVTRLVEVIKHAFTVQLPAYAKFLGETILEGITFPLRAGIVASENFANTFGKIFDRLQVFLYSRMQGGFAKLGADIGKITGESLLKGFETSFPSLPQIAERAITDREIELQRNVTNAAENIADEFNRRLEGRLVGFDQVIKEQSDKMALAMTGQPNASATATNQQAKSSSQLAAASALQAQTGRLLTMGPASETNEILRQIASNTQDAANSASAQKMAEESRAREEAASRAQIAAALAKAPQLAAPIQ